MIDRVKEHQRWLCSRSVIVSVDGGFGPITRAATRQAFVNRDAPGMDRETLNEFARRLDCLPRQIAAVAEVESRGGGFGDDGLPTILFERHLFWRLSDGRHPRSAINHPGPTPRGGYGTRAEQWAKLLRAASLDVDAAFGACSWGKFQVLGLHWRDLHYESPVDLAFACTSGEAAHYDLLCRYIERNGLVPALRSVSSDPDDCRTFAKAYNGPEYARFGYHEKLARAMR